MVVLGVALSGCSAAQQEPGHAAPSEQKIFVAAPCAPLQALLKADAPPPLTFFELADVREALPSDAASVLATRAVRSNHVTALIVEGAGSVTGPWSICENAACSRAHEGTATVQITQPPEQPSAPIAFKVTITSEGKAAEPRKLETRDQTPLVIELSANEGGGSLAITPYYLADRSEEGGQALLDCKRR